MSRGRRVDSLEAAQRAFEAKHLPLSDVGDLLREVLAVVRDEAGVQVAGRVAGRLVARQVRRVEQLRAWRP